MILSLRAAAIASVMAVLASTLVMAQTTGAIRGAANPLRDRSATWSESRLA
jgi:hypothetical protein